MSVVAELPKPREELRRAILLSGMPAWKVGHLAGLSSTIVSHIVTGRRGVRGDEAERLAAVLDADPVELFPELEEVAV